MTSHDALHWSMRPLMVGVKGLVMSGCGGHDGDAATTELFLIANMQKAVLDNRRLKECAHWTWTSISCGLFSTCVIVLCHASRVRRRWSPIQNTDLRIVPYIWSQVRPLLTFNGSIVYSLQYEHRRSPKAMYQTYRARTDQ